eukprot:GHVT01087542.1.p1 GENE.GHVT01087542.1~~GHVT01087542.1.p1  ORF type:complete len:139 (-),score=4.55 GHVT01087542.1:263-679(-)
MLRPHVQMGGGGARSSAGLRAVSSAQGGICTAERRYLEDGMAMGHRIDGRSCLQYRPSTVEYGILPSANGSARMWTRDNNDVLVSVKVSRDSKQSCRNVKNSTQLGICSKMTHPVSSSYSFQLWQLSNRLAWEAYRDR